MPKKNKAKAPQFNMITKDFLADPETDKLSNAAFRVWIYARDKFDPKKPSLEFSLTYKEMEKRMSKPTYSKALKGLIAAKLIEQTKKGGLYERKSRYKFIGDHRYFYCNGKVIK